MVSAILACSNESERLLLRACLEGYAVAPVESLEDAAAAMARSKPDLVLARIGPNDPAGMQLLRLMKRSQLRVPTIVVLPRQPGSLLDEVSDMEVRAFVLCPIQYRDVRRVVGQVRRDARQVNHEGAASSRDGEHNAGVHGNESGRDSRCMGSASRMAIRSCLR